jgi:hypothetical protein
VDYFSESTPGVKYQSFEEALAVGKEAREVQDMEDYRRFTTATGLPETKEGYVGYRKEKGAQREVEKQKAEKNAAIARQMFEKDRAFRASRIDRAMANRQEAAKVANYRQRTEASSRDRELARQATASGTRRTSQRTAKDDFLKQFHENIAKGYIPEGEIPMHLKGMGINPGDLDYYQAMGAGGAYAEGVQDKDIESRIKAVRDIIEAGDLRPLNRIDTTDIPYNSQETLHSEIQTARSNIITEREQAKSLRAAWDEEKKDHAGQGLDASDKELEFSNFIRANGASAVMRGSYDHPVFVEHAEGIEGKSLEEVSPFSPWISPMADSGVDQSGFLTSPARVNDSYDVDLPPGSIAEEVWGPVVAEEWEDAPIPEGVPLSEAEAAKRAAAEADYQAAMEDARIRRENPHVEGYVKSLQEVPNKFSEALVGAWKQAKERYEDHAFEKAKEEAEMAEALAYERDWEANAAKEVDAVPPKFVGKNTMFTDPTGVTDFGSLARGSSVERPWYGDMGSMPGQVASLAPEMINAAGQMLNVFPSILGVGSGDHYEGPLPTTRTKTVETPMLSPLEYTGGKKPVVSVEYANRELLPRYLDALKKARAKDGRGLDVNEEDALRRYAMAQLLENYELPKNYQHYSQTPLGFN